MQIHAYRDLLPPRRPIKTLLRIMRITAILLFTCYFGASAKTGLSQKITLKEKDAPLIKLFHEIEKQSGFQFFFSDNDLKYAKTVSIDADNADFLEVLKACFKDQPISFEIVDKTVVVKPVRQTASDNSPPSPPPGEIHGHITNAQGAPLSGANVIVSRTKRGTQTDPKGEFTLKTVYPDDVLTVSFIGYKTMSVKVRENKEFPLILEEAKNELDKVVVQAYGNTTQRLATGSIATVTKEEIERQPVVNPLQALQGRVAGLVVTQTSGYASAPFTVEIRGRNTIGNVPADPLYIIDGVPLTVLEVPGSGSGYQNGSTGLVQNPYMAGPAGGQSPFFSLDPADIESITVLKDADATAIYGSRGANGVIVVTTKTGNVGKSKLDMNVYQGMSIVTRHYDLLNTRQYLQMRREAFANDGITPNTGNAYDLLVWDTTRNTDWQKYLWGGSGKITDAQLSLSGGNKLTNFRIAGGYYHMTDITTAKGANQRGSLQFNLTHKSLDQRLTTVFSNNYSVATTNMISQAGLVLEAPDAPAVFGQNGKLNYKGYLPAIFPFGSLLRPYSSTTYFLNSRVSLSYEILKGLTISSNLGYSNSTVEQKSETPIASQDLNSDPKGTSQFGYNNNINWIIEPQLKYNRLVSEGKLDVLFGASTQSVSFTGNNISGGGYPNDNLLGSISNAPSKNAFDNYLKYKYAALFGRLTYNWLDKYVLNLSVRRDGSSRFGPSKQFGNFGALGAAWIFSEENWIKNHFRFLSFGKFRGSYGTTGNDQIGDYQYITRWQGTGLVPYQGNASYIPIQHANPDLQWQLVKKLEFALDLSFLKNRLNFEAAWYRNRCGNELVTYPLPVQTGFVGVTENLPAEIQNTGLEFLVNAKIIDHAKLNWNVNFNIGINRNKLLSFPNLSQSSYANRMFVGKSLNLAQALHFTGVDPQTGQYTYQDKNKDGQISTNYDSTGDLYAFDLSPKFSGGFGMDFKYRNWQLNIFFHFKKQIGNNAFANINPPGSLSNIPNVPAEVLNRWRKPGTKPLLRDLLASRTHPIITLVVQTLLTRTRHLFG